MPCAIVVLMLTGAVPLRAASRGLPGPPLSQSDTTRPAVPSLPGLPTDSTFTVPAPDLLRCQALYYRNIVGIIFHDSTSGTTIRRVLARYRGKIIGGVPGAGEYIVQIPDPGHSFAAVEAIVRRLQAERGVVLGRSVYYRTPVYLDGRRLHNC